MKESSIIEKIESIKTEIISLIKSQMASSLRTEIAKLKLEKDEKLIVTIRDHNPTCEMLDSLIKSFSKLCPGHEIIVIHGDIDVTIVREEGS